MRHKPITHAWRHQSRLFVAYSPQDVGWQSEDVLLDCRYECKNEGASHRVSPAPKEVRCDAPESLGDAIPRSCDEAVSDAIGVVCNRNHHSGFACPCDAVPRPVVASLLSLIRWWTHLHLKQESSHRTKLQNYVKSASASFVSLRNPYLPTRNHIMMTTYFHSLVPLQAKRLEDEIWGPELF